MISSIFPVVPLVLLVCSSFFVIFYHVCGPAVGLTSGRDPFIKLMKQAPATTPPPGPLSLAGELGHAPHVCVGRTSCLSVLLLLLLFVLLLPLLLLLVVVGVVAFAVVLVILMLMMVVVMVVVLLL